MPLALFLKELKVRLAIPKVIAFVCLRLERNLDLVIAC